MKKTLIIVCSLFLIINIGFLLIDYHISTLFNMFVAIILLFLLLKGDIKK